MRKIKVFQVITRLIRGGASKVCLDLAELLPQDKYELTLISGLRYENEGSFFDRAQNIKHLKIRTLSSLVREISPFNDFISLVRLFILFCTAKPDIVHCHTSKAGFIGCTAAKLAGVPVIIYSPHGHLFAPQAEIPEVSGADWRLRLFYLLRKLASTCASRIVALTNADKQEQVKLRLAPAKKYEVIYNGIDTSPAHTQLLAEPPEEGYVRGYYPVLATIGRLSREKGHSYLMETLKLIKEQYPKPALVIMGDGDMRPELERLTEQLGLKENVRFLGVCPDIFSILKETDIFVLPSLYEAFGLVLLEAMLMKKPVVASRVSGIPEVVSEGQTGLLVPPADPARLAGAILRLAGDNDLARRMGQAGYQRVQELFQREEMVNKFEKLYQELSIK